MGRFPPMPPFSSAGTSEEAAASMREHVPTYLRICLLDVRQRMLHGAVCFEIENAHGIKHQNASARLNYLEKLGYIFVVEPLDRLLDMTRKYPPERARSALRTAAAGGITRARGGRPSNVYFAHGFVTLEEVCRHHGVSMSSEANDQPETYSPQHNNLFSW